MIILTSSRNLPEPLVPHATDLLITAFHDGTGGYAVLNDDAARAVSSAVVVGDFVYLAGSPDTKLVRDLAEHHNDELHIMPADESWWQLLEADRGAQTSRYTRYAFDTERFDWGVFFAAQEQAQRIMEETGVRVERLSAKHIDRHARETWFEALICQFTGPEDFLERGTGFVVVEDGDAVSGASSYAVYAGGIEVEVGTRGDRRGRGYATLASRALLQWGRETGTFIAWDAANTTSRRLAERLGYRDPRPYDCLLYTLHSVTGNEQTEHGLRG